jgi:cell division protein FtsI (penicillin-binding protein 3)
MNAATEAGGTARRIRIDGIEISAKTGTAQVFNNATSSYSEEEFIASTLALLPTHDPEIAIYAVIDHPRGDTFYGGRIAAPVAREAARFLIPHLGIPRSTNQVVAHSGVIQATTPGIPPFENTLPDFTGLPKRALLPLLERDDIRVRIQGSGWVVSQSPPPGTSITDNMTVTLELE